MTELDCRRAERIEADAEMGQASDYDRARHEAHVQRCSHCAQRAQRLRAIADVLREEADRIELGKTDRALVAGAIMEAGGGASAPRRRPTPVLWLAAAAILLGAGIGATAVWLTGGAEPARVAEQPAPAAPRGSTEDAPDEGPGPGPGTPGTTPPGQAPPPMLAAGAGEPCRGVRTQAADDARAYVLSRRVGSCRLVLDVGRVRFEVSPAAATSLQVHTPTTTVTVVGTELEVGVTPEGTTEVEVYEGKVRVETAQQTAVLERGDVFTSGEPADDEATERARTAPSGGDRDRPAQQPADDASTTGDAPPDDEDDAPQTAAEAQREVAALRRMIAHGKTAEARAEARERSAEPQDPSHQAELLTVIAESWAREGRHQRAVDAYRRVWRAHPGSTTAANALLAAANLTLDRLGDPQGARRLYERYLQDYPTGALREVAFVGRCRALRAEGRAEAARTCLRTYLATHPEGRLRDRARKLLGR